MDVVYASVPRLWPESTIVCIGGGSSLTQQDVDYCRGKARVIVVNDGYRIAPWADVLYAADAKWWQKHSGVPVFEGLKYSVQAEAQQWPGVQLLRTTGETGLELKPTSLRTGSNSGYQAINLAVHLGATRVLLLGYDMQNGPKGKSHWFGDHPWGCSSQYGTFLVQFATIVEPLRQIGVEVINCTRRTVLNCFPKQSLEAALPTEMACS